jgi:hypothetical protein
MIASTRHQILRAQFGQMVNIFVTPFLFSSQRCPPPRPVPHGRFGHKARPGVIGLGAGAELDVNPEKDDASLVVWEIGLGAGLGQLPVTVYMPLP